MITAFKKIEQASQRGSLFQWTYNGSVVSAFWPNEYATMPADSGLAILDKAAATLNNGMVAAADEIALAAKKFLPSELQNSSRESISRFVAGPFRYFRDRAIQERSAIKADRYALAQPVDLPSPTPLTQSMASLERQEIRQFFAKEFSPSQVGEAFDFMVKSKGVRVFNAICPWLEFSIFARDNELSSQILDEFAIRKWMLTIDNKPDDSRATAADPLKNKMGDDVIRSLANARLGGLKLREEAVGYSEKLLLSVIAFAGQAGDLTPDDALRLLIGQKAA
ncbi:hypothetical protein NKI09_17635 [Mesorhizobium sp. M0757]|uniref:hypothetical protein n=1 Tax=Mesorhizobium sp. M0757 TaxID=2956993 RepID=UPI00333A2B38